MEQVKRRRLDLLLTVVALLFGAPSLGYPFGRDQGLYYYVAREWVSRGLAPYRDVLDHKTPGIYVLHALTIVLFGEHMWGIRVADLFCVGTLGWIAARVVTPRGEEMPRGLAGLSVCAASVFFYGYLNWWDTAQSELWYAMLGLGAVAAARCMRGERASQLAAGALGAAAMIMKPPAVWLVTLAFAALVHRAWQPREGRARRAARAALGFGAGFAVPVACVFGYLAATHSLSAFLDIVVGANGYYVAHERGAVDAGDVFGHVMDYVAVYAPMTALGVFALVRAPFRRGASLGDAQTQAYVVAGAACLAAFAAVAMQSKYFMLHWGVMVGGAAVVFAAVMREAFALRGATPRSAAGGLMALVIAFILSGHAVQSWFDSAKLVVRRAAGAVSREAFASRFEFPEIGFSYADSEAAGRWLRDHAAPTDLVAVRGFEPQIYAVSGHHHAGRFFWTTFLTAPGRAYHRVEWLAEDRAALDAHPPRFVVVYAGVTEGPDSRAYFPGYEERGVFGNLAILEHR
jgi:hypothetical protein